MTSARQDWWAAAGDFFADLDDGGCVGAGHSRNYGTSAIFSPDFLAEAEEHYQLIGEVLQAKKHFELPKPYTAWYERDGKRLIRVPAKSQRSIHTKSQQKELGQPDEPIYWQMTLPEGSPVIVWIRKDGAKIYG